MQDKALLARMKRRLRESRKTASESAMQVLQAAPATTAASQSSRVTLSTTVYDMWKKVTWRARSKA